MKPRRKSSSATVRGHTMREHPRFRKRLLQMMALDVVPRFRLKSSTGKSPGCDLGSSKEPRSKPRCIWRDRLCPVRWHPRTTRRSPLQATKPKQASGQTPKGNENQPRPRRRVTMKNVPVSTSSAHVPGSGTGPKLKLLIV